MSHDKNINNTRWIQKLEHKMTVTSELHHLTSQVGFDICFHLIALKLYLQCIYPTFHVNS